MKHSSPVLPKGWSISTIQELGTIVAGSTPSRNEPSYWGGNIRWITPSDMAHLPTRFISGGAEDISQAGIAHSGATLLPEKSLVVTTRATIGVAAITMNELATNQGFKNIIPNQNVDVNFLYYKLSTIKNEMIRLASGTTFLEISKKAFGSIKIEIPDKREQEIISESLIAIDDRIVLQQRKLQKLHKLKDGLLHDLLTRGIGEDGKLRDPIAHPEQFKVSKLGVIPKFWNIVPLDQLAQIIMGQSPPGHTYNDFGNGMPLINGPVEFGERYPTAIQWTTSPTKICLPGDVLFCVRGSTTGRMNISNGTYCIGRGVAAIRGKEGISTTGFIELFLQRIAEDILSEARGNGSTFPSVNSTRLASTSVIQIPITEQKKIVEKLDAISSCLYSNGECLNKLIKIKLGLMHDLLTGTVRTAPLLTKAA